MSGYVGSQRIMEPSTSTSYLTNTPQPILGSPTLASSCGSRAEGRFASGKIRKESKYIENSRQDKLFSRVWLPSQANTSPKVNPKSSLIFCKYKWFYQTLNWECQQLD